MSAALVRLRAGDFEPEKFTDEYQEQLRKLIEAKLEQGDALDTEETFGEEEEERGRRRGHRPDGGAARSVEANRARPKPSSGSPAKKKSGPSPPRRQRAPDSRPESTTARRGPGR